MQTGQRMPLTTTMQVKGGAAKQGDTEADLGITCQPCRERDGGGSHTLRPQLPAACFPQKLSTVFTPSCWFDHDGMTANTFRPALWWNDHQHCLHLVTNPFYHDGMTISTINTYLPTCFIMMEWPSTLLTPTYLPASPWWNDHQHC